MIGSRMKSLVASSIVTLAVVSLSSCGSPMDETWSGKAKNCTNGGSTEVELVLNGPVTANPDGKWRVANGTNGWIEAEISDSSYVGTKLKFTAEFSATVAGQKLVAVDKVELTREMGKLTGTVEEESGTSSLKCDIELTPDD